MKISQEMKRTLTVVLAIAVVCLMTACQPTPENAAVIQKDNFERLIGNTAQPTQQQAIEDQSHITWDSAADEDFSGGTSTVLTVHVDAVVNVPQNTASVYAVEPDEYNLDFAQKAADYFIGDTYYDDVFTKEDLLLKIIPLKQAIQSMDDENTKEGAESFLKIYERQYEEAPESNAPGEIAFKDLGYNYVGLKGYPYGGAVSEMYMGNGGMGYTDFYYVVQDGKKEYCVSNLKYSGIPARQMETTYEDAKKMAEDAIAALYGETMSLAQTDLYNLRFVDENWGWDYFETENESYPQAYMFTFTPIYGGLAQLYAPKASNSDNLQEEGVSVYEPRWDYEYSMKWPAQYVQVLVDDNGIVQFWGFSPTKVTGTVNDNVEILPFDEILEIFKKNIFYCSAWSSNGLTEVSIDIDTVNFGMIRVPVKDAPETYYMIPAWQFAGTKTEKSGTTGETYTESGKTFLVLNALDGGLVDTSYYDNVALTLSKAIGVSKDWGFKG